MHRLARTVVRNSAFGAASSLAIRLLSFGFSILVVRQLGVEAFGQYAAVLAFGALFVFLADLGLGNYAVREVARHRAEQDGTEQAGALFGDILVLRLLLAVLTALLLVTAAWLTGRPAVMVGAIALGTLGLLMYGAQGACEAMLAGFERLDLSSSAKAIQQLAFVLVGTAVLWLGLGYYGLIFANLGAVALLTLLCWTGVRRLGVRPAGLRPARWGSLLRASLPFGVIGFALGLSYKLDSVLLNLFLGDADTGLYSSAYGLIFSAAILSNVVNTSLWPTMVRHFSAGPDMMPSLLGSTVRYLLTMALPLAVGCWLLSDKIISFLFSPAYQAAAPVLAIVAWVIPLMFMSEFLGYVAILYGHERACARAVVVSTGLNVLLNVILIPRFGVLAAAWVTVLTEVVLVGQYVLLLRGQLAPIDWQHSLMRPLLAALLMGGTVLLVRDLMLLMVVPIGALAYAVLLPALGIVGQQELHFLRELGARRHHATP